LSFCREPNAETDFNLFSWPTNVFRRIRDPQTGLPTSLYRTEILKSDNGSAKVLCPQGFAPTLLDPRIVYTNGSADFGGEVLNVSCIDSNVYMENKVFAVICEPKMEATKGYLDDPHEKCGKSGQVCLPKCCQAGEVFNVMKMNCEQVSN
jgi:hypothetical protein